MLIFAAPPLFFTIEPATAGRLWSARSTFDMPALKLTHPITFQPIFMERVWGGRRLESLFGKRLPPAVLIGESWEIVDRPEAQSVVHEGPLRGKTLHQLWTKHRQQIFGNVPDSSGFPLLIKLLDAQQKLSVQVHPPATVAKELGGEPKTEFWYIADAGPGAELFVGLKKDATRNGFEKALKKGNAQELLHRISTKAGDSMFLPSGRVHAIGEGNVMVEIQQNSDTTYRVFDWNRPSEGKKPRELHIEQSMKSIDFEDYEPRLVEPSDDVLIKNPLFEVQKWEFDSAREGAPLGKFAIFTCLSGEVECSGQQFKPGDFFLLPAQLAQRELKPCAKSATVLRTMIPG